MIFISHDLGVLSLISDKLVVMHRGLAVERGLLEEIFEHARGPYTRTHRSASLSHVQPGYSRRKKFHAAEAKDILHSAGKIRRGSSAVDVEVLHGLSIKASKGK